MTLLHSNLYFENRQSGFTLIEALVVISIVAIIAAFAYPSMQRQIAQARMTQTAGDIESALKTARANALIQKTEIETTIDVTNKTMAVLGSDGKSFTYPNNVLVEPQNNVTTFTGRKTASANSYEICYEGIPMQRIIVNVDVRSNITVDRNGGDCP